MIIAAIPVLNNLKWTAPLIESLLNGDAVDKIWLYDNGSTDNTASWVKARMINDSRLEYFDSSGMKLYHMWNDMVSRAAEIGGVKLAILNNDIRLPFMALKTMADNMGDYKIACIDTARGSFYPIIGPNINSINWSERVGWAFMIDADFWKDEPYAVHPDLIIWWGDDDLYRRCQNRGGNICMMRGIGCDHSISATDSEYIGDKGQDIESDRLTFSTIWS